MPNSQFHTAISQPRYSRYLAACGCKKRALKLYRANIHLSQKMYALIGILEIVLRNSIDRHMVTQKGPNWLENAVALDGYLRAGPGCEESLHAVQKAINKRGIKNSHDSLIPELTFGFWRHQFGPKEFTAAGSSLLNVFINRPFGISQRDILQRLTQINAIRNRIAHHEPICFEGTQISTAKIERRYNTILELLLWLGCNQRKILYGIDGVRNAIVAINNI